MHRAWLLLIIFVTPAAAFTEAEAPQVDDRIVAVGHSPEVPEPGQQWTGFIQLHPDTNITAVNYQICRVGNACFGPPTPATDMGDGRWVFDTREYALDFEGNPVPWGINRDDHSDWLVGVKYVVAVNDSEEMQDIPKGRDDCIDVSEDQYIHCDSTHYFTFTMPGVPENAGDEGAPMPAVAWLSLTLVALAALRRRVT